ncbi:MAG TPA: hypothetical protein VNG53_06935 [Bacteroidia bacterium]|nr:hypothetical protein [Bacteroidia bacterium]
MKKMIITFSISLLLLLFNSNNAQAQFVRVRHFHSVERIRPICRATQLVWISGYWRWDGYFGRYFWIPGRWIERPRIWISY